MTNGDGLPRYWVKVQGHNAVALDDGAVVRFGRRDVPADVPPVLGLRADDDGVSHRQCDIRRAGATVYLDNVSTKVRLYVEYPDAVLHQRVYPGETHVFRGRALVLVPGAIEAYRVEVNVSTALTNSGGGDSEKTVPTHRVVMTPHEHRALAAVAESYLLRFPRHEEHPLSYAEAAKRIGLTKKQVEKRIENLKKKIDPTLRTKDVARTVIEWMAASGQLKVADLALLDKPDCTQDFVDS